MPPNRFTARIGGGTPFVPVAYSERDPSRQFSQELRLTSHDVGGLHWVAGAFYSNLHSVWNEIGANPLATRLPEFPTARTSPPGTLTAFRQTALFADGSYKFTESMEAVRWRALVRLTRAIRTSIPGATTAPTSRRPPIRRSPRPRQRLQSAGQPVLHPRPDLTTYATISKGFRPGGANQILPPPIEPPFCQNGALQFGPDRAWNYEVGEKAKLFDNWLTINSDMYYIKWTGYSR